MIFNQTNFKSTQNEINSLKFLTILISISKSVHIFRKFQAKMEFKYGICIKLAATCWEKNVCADRYFSNAEIKNMQEIIGKQILTMFIFVTSRLELHINRWKGTPESNAIRISFKFCVHIEFTAVVQNLKTGHAEAEFQEFVRPTEIPIMGQYCTDVTGITQENVNTAETLPSVLRSFNIWISLLQKQKDVRLYNSRNRRPNAVIITWTNYDLATYMRRECERKRIRRAAYFNRWIQGMISE